MNLFRILVALQAVLFGLPLLIVTTALFGVALYTTAIGGLEDLRSFGIFLLLAVAQGSVTCGSILAYRYCRRGYAGLLEAPALWAGASLGAFLAAVSLLLALFGLPTPFIVGVPALVLFGQLAYERLYHQEHPSGAEV
jgi:hypothetical protein